MDNLIANATLVLYGVLGGGGVILLLIYLTPNKFDQWVSKIGYCLSKLGGIFNHLHKRAVQLDLQGNINSYVNKLSESIPTLDQDRVKVQYIDKKQGRKSFIENNKVVLMLHREDPQDLNFVHGAFLFVSTSLLYRAKRYISQSQRDALDLYVTAKLIENEKSERVGYFLDEYLYPKLKDEDHDRKKYFDKLSLIDEGGYFYPILLEELYSLGGKVFGGRQDSKIIIDVRELIDFLVEVSHRIVGSEELDLNFHGEYCRASIVIIGKANTIAINGSEKYLKYIRSKLLPQDVDNLYIIGDVKNKVVIDEVCEEISEVYDIVRKREAKTLLHLLDDRKITVDTYFVFLCRAESSIVVPEKDF